MLLSDLILQPSKVHIYHFPQSHCQRLIFISVNGQGPLPLLNVISNFTVPFAFISESLLFVLLPPQLWCLPFLWVNVHVYGSCGFNFIEPWCFLCSQVPDPMCNQEYAGVNIAICTHSWMSWAAFTPSSVQGSHSYPFIPASWVIPSAASTWVWTDSAGLFPILVCESCVC